ncbi:Uncharacterized protein PHPALM_13938 [Phytophthora palmivora]|uniref:Uncharacterized protein n=1 Tax=Phytophthora palmivora TaxID=4796 RepID=A0A2P4XW19_9STRA|nr:Uncharacterized protein PHPALM_13938 [Phytophthora palmivora]
MKVLDHFSDCIPYPITTPAERNTKLFARSQPSTRKTVARGLKCLSGTKDYVLLLGRSLDVTPENLADKLSAYSDADYANCADTRRSIGGHVTILASSPISWLSPKHHTVVLSTIEA